MQKYGVLKKGVDEERVDVFLLKNGIFKRNREIYASLVGKRYSQNRHSEILSFSVELFVFERGMERFYHFSSSVLVF